MSDLIFRAATEADLPAIVAMLADDHLGAQRESLDNLTPYREALSQITDDPRLMQVVCERYGTIAGTMQLSITPGLSRKGMSRMQIEGVRVSSITRGGGVGGQINLSAFVFRDMDLDGIYSLGDRPYNGVSVRMTTPEGVSTRRRSNYNGFSNFAASNTREDALIRTTGVHTFEVIPPPGWYVTTDNQVQAVTVSEHPGSIAGLVMNHLPHPIGMAPNLEIRGNANALRSVYEDEHLIATAPDGAEFKIESNADGSFVVPASSGTWLIGGQSANQPPRQVAVRNVPVFVSAAPHEDIGNDQSKSVILGFDDLTPGSTLLKVPNGYGGLGWSGLNAISFMFTSGEGYVNTTQSGEYLSYSSSGHPVHIFSDTPFDFVGGYFGIAWPSAEGETIRARAYRGETLISEDAFQGSAYGAVYFAANYRGITSVEFTTDHFWQFVVDDMEFIVSR